MSKLICSVLIVCLFYTGQVKATDYKLYLVGEIDEQSTTETRATLEHLKYGDNAYLYINSPGGSAKWGMEVVKSMKRSKGKTIAVLNNKARASSMAGVILLAAKYRIIYPNSRIMLHAPFYPFYFPFTSYEIYRTQDDSSIYNKFIFDTISPYLTKSEEIDIFVDHKDLVFTGEQMNYRINNPFGLR